MAVFVYITTDERDVTNMGDSRNSRDESVNDVITVKKQGESKGDGYLVLTRERENTVAGREGGFSSK